MRASKACLSNDLIDNASGAVVDRTICYIGLVINGEEHAFYTADLPSFDEAIALLTLTGVPIYDVRHLRRIFWLIAGTTLLIIFGLSFN